MPRFLILRNCQMINVCCFELLTYGVNLLCSKSYLMQMKRMSKSVRKNVLDFQVAFI